MREDLKKKLLELRKEQNELYSSSGGEELSLEVIIDKFDDINQALSYIIEAYGALSEEDREKFDKNYLSYLPSLDEFRADLDRFVKSLMG